MKIGKREQAIRRVVLDALKVGQNAALDAAKNAQQLGADAQVAAKVVKYMWDMIEEGGEQTDYVWDVLETLKQRGEY
jgi:hypothetical protein